MRRYHDLGGEPDGPIDFTDHDAAPWEKMITALWGAARARGITNLDEMRRLVEDLPPDIYDRGYTECRAEAMRNILDERGLITRDEVANRMAEIKARLETKT
jgi:hypothetical protein